MTEPTVIAEFADYPSMVAGLRKRAHQLRAKGELLDEIAGLPKGYVGKLLAPRPMRRLGMISMGTLSGALGIKYLMIEDAEAVKRFGGMLTKRDETAVRSGAVEYRMSRRFLSKMGRKGGLASRKNMSKRKATKISRDANKVRWAKHRAAPPPAKRKRTMGGTSLRRPPMD